MRRRYLQLTAAVAITVIALTPAFLIGQQSPRQLFERAKIVEEANTDLTQAIRLYEQVIAQSKDRSLSAGALLRMAGCYEKLGNSVEARKFFQEIESQYKDQTALVLQARQYLDDLAARSNSPKGTLTDRLLWTVTGARLNSITPDGRWMSSGTRTDGAIRNALTGEIKLMIDGADGPLISSDGKTVVFNFHGTDSLRPKGDAEPAQLRIMGVEPGSKPRVLVSTPEIRYCIPVAWSPDSKKVLLEITKPDGTWQIGWLPVSNGETNQTLTLKSLDWRLVRLTTQHASLSPDGRYIAYSALTNNPKTRDREDSDRDSDAQDIYIISSDGSGGERVLTKTGGINEAPVWTPDGTHILFISDRSGAFDLYSVAVKDGEATGFPLQVKKGVGRIIPINTMTQSGTYYYVSKPESEVHVAEMEPSTMNFRGFGAGGAETFPGLRPTWSPDGQSIAFSRLRADGQTADLVVQSLKTGLSRIYLTGNHDVARGQVVQWFHDSKSLLKGNCPTCIPALYRVQLNNGNITEVGGSQGFVTGIAAISSDEKTVYLRVTPQLAPVKNTRVAALEFDTAPGDPLQLSLKPDSRTMRKEIRDDPSPDHQRHGYAPSDGVSDFVLSPDGRTFALTTDLDPKSSEVYLGTIAAADGQDYRRIYGPFRSDRFGHKVAWTKDGRTILFAVSDSNDRWKIMRIPAAGGSAEFTGLEVERLRNFDLSPDGTHIAFEVDADPTWQIRAFNYVSSNLNSGR